MSGQRTGSRTGALCPACAMNARAARLSGRRAWAMPTGRSSGGVKERISARLPKALDTTSRYQMREPRPSVTPVTQARRSSTSRVGTGRTPRQLNMASISVRRPVPGVGSTIGSPSSMRRGIGWGSREPGAR